MKRILFILLISGACTLSAFAKELPVTVTPVNKLTTSGKSLHEGDFVDFKVVKDCGTLKKGDLVTGLVTNLDPNGFTGKTAYLAIEEFRVKSTGEKLNGGIYSDGNPHNQIMEFKGNLILSTLYVRGGEIIIKPDKHTFLLYQEVKEK